MSEITGTLFLALIRHAKGMLTALEEWVKCQMRVLQDG